jgi:hypothetical protein
MTSVTFQLDSKLLSDLDRLAHDREVSRSRAINDILRDFFTPKKASTSQLTILDNEIQHKDEIILLLEGKITDLREQNSQLWESFTDCNNRLTQFLLPPPDSNKKRGFWDRLRGR